MVGGEVTVGRGDSLYRGHLLPAFDEVCAVLDAFNQSYQGLLPLSPPTDEETESEEESECQEQSKEKIVWDQDHRGRNRI